MAIEGKLELILVSFLFPIRCFLFFCLSDWQFSPMDRSTEGEEVFPFPHLSIVSALPMPVLLWVTTGNVMAAVSERMGSVI